MTREQMENHLTLLGYYPVRDTAFDLDNGFAYEVWNETQVYTLTKDFGFACMAEEWNPHTRAEEEGDHLEKTTWATLPEAAFAAFAYYFEQELSHG